MPTSYRPKRPIRAEILPLLSSSSKSNDSHIAKASNSLWSRIVQTNKPNIYKRESKVGIAVEWPEDRRLGKGKERSLVVWVEKLEEDAINHDGSILYIHPSLLPPFSITPLSVLLHIHEPLELSLAILQPVLEHENDNLPSQDDIDLTSLYSSSHHSKSLVNGDSHSLHPPVIRQGGLLPHPQKLKVLLLEPVIQGLLTSSTRIIISTDPYISSQEEGGYEDEIGLGGEGSIARSSMSLTNFDPDTFLSSNLSLSLTVPGNIDGEDEILGSISSSTSGSLTPRPGDRPPSPPIGLDELITEEVERGTKFTAVRASGTYSGGVSEEGEDVCWMGVGGLGRAGIFEGDWVSLISSSTSTSTNGRLVKALAWERLDEYDEDLPLNPILLPASLYRSLSISSSSSHLTVQPTPFGARQPSLPIAKTMTLARIATAEGVDKRYERAWLKGLKAYFSNKCKGKSKDTDNGNERLIRSGDIISIPVYLSKPMESDETIEDDEEDENEDKELRNWRSQPKYTGLVYFTITSLSYDPLVPLEEDFKISISSKARAGELGCWFDMDGSTKMVLTGIEKDRIQHRQGDFIWHDIESPPPPFAAGACTKLRDLLQTAFAYPTLSYLMQLSILVKGARGSGKRSLIRYISNDLGYNVIDVECYDIIGDSSATTQGILQARIEKAKLCSPSLIVLHNIEALAKKTESTVLGRPPSIVKTLEDLITSAKQSSDWPVVVLGTTVDADAVPNEVLGVFKQDVEINAPNEIERFNILRNTLSTYEISPDIDLKTIARQTAALHAGDINSLILRANDLSLKRVFDSSNKISINSAKLAGIQITLHDLNEAINQARNSYSDSIGAPKIPNVTWDDVGGLAHIKKDILDTVQLPLERGDLFGEGLKKRSGILLYGPPGTGKTLLAKAVATSCSLNFFSVKGPELLNMYIGESEANVRRVFQRARDASPCVIFMDELDSIAPKRGNQGDSGGVMDRIVSQLLAELDGMSNSDVNSNSQIFVLGATNRPDLLDSSLLRPGRFDKMLYLSIPSTNKEQLDILNSLTRKFNLDENLKLNFENLIIEKLNFNYTGADLYSLCSDSILNSMIRISNNINEKVIQINRENQKDENEKNGNKTKEINVEYYLSKIATSEEIKVKVTYEDFEIALKKLKPSVSEEELKHYERVQREFKNYNIGNKEEEKETNSFDGDSLIGSHANGHNGPIRDQILTNGDTSTHSTEEHNGYGSAVLGLPNEHNGGKGQERIDGIEEEIDRKGKGKAKQVDADA
uniref:Peroxisomal ATPase PEX6 n=1 Tax=Kwoniella pini CBS 10737 TaxID=1296096 RepID=A0A1B9I0B4_9TREE|nr:uncharacterized protein I206_04666 [Kwoniella pini CBS 10737]OCF48979.1 hypothetical protein I206_04666 [Kwoniella pini CBS 10737]